MKKYNYYKMYSMIEINNPLVSNFSPMDFFYFNYHKLSFAVTINFVILHQTKFCHDSLKLQVVS